MNPVSAAVLYAEDDENDVFFMERAFAKIGYTHLRVVPSGRDAVAALTDALAAGGNGATPALAILDLNLPFLNGHEVLQWIRQRAEFADLPVIVFTSSAQLSDIDRAYAAGATAYVIKPNSPLQVVEFARLVLRVLEARTACGAIMSGFSGFRPPPAR